MNLCRVNHIKRNYLFRNKRVLDGRDYAHNNTHTHTQQQQRWVLRFGTIILSIPYNYCNINFNDVYLYTFVPVIADIMPIRLWNVHLRIYNITNNSVSENEWTAVIRKMSNFNRDKRDKTCRTQKWNWKRFTRRDLIFKKNHLSFSTFFSSSKCTRSVSSLLHDIILLISRLALSDG